MANRSFRGYGETNTLTERDHLSVVKENPVANQNARNFTAVLARDLGA
jgi:hypothetical protein